MVDSGITFNGIGGAGKHDKVHEGPTTVVYDEFNIGDYNKDNNTGSNLDVQTRYGISRLRAVHVEAIDGAGYVAEYDYANGSIRVFEAGADADTLDEVSQGTTIDTDFRLEVRGVA